MKFTAQSIIAASALISGAVAQTYTECNPLEKKCPNDPALGTSYTVDYTKSQKESNMFTATGSKNCITYGSDGMTMAVKAAKDSPTLTSNFYIFSGQIDVKMKAAQGAGVISSLVFESDCLDEIDYEWVGNQPTKVQTNYFGKGNTTTYDRGAFHDDPGAFTSFKTYTIKWTKESVTWYINGNLVRSLTPAQVKGDFYPQTPMQIKIGAWDAGFPDQVKGTLEWAGGHTDYKQEHKMVVQSITVTDYSTGAKEYSYGDKSGKWDSIVISNTKSTSDEDTDSSSSSNSTTSADNSTATSTTLSTEPSSNATSTSDDNTQVTGDAGSSSSSSETSAPAAPTPSGSGAGALKALSGMGVAGIVAAFVFAL